MELIELKTNGIPSVTITQLAQSKPEYWLEQFWLNTSKMLQKPPKHDCMHSEREGSRRMLMYSLPARSHLHCFTVLDLLDMFMLSVHVTTFLMTLSNKYYGLLRGTSLPR